MDQSEALILLGAGREKKIYAVPPYCRVVSLAFDDHPFAVEGSTRNSCTLCGASGVYLDEMIEEKTGARSWQCNDTSFCRERRNGSAGDE
jgi:alpha-D-ribose 1-methylphosphonate 5-phosphate C-P lyase